MLRALAAAAAFVLLGALPAAAVSEGERAAIRTVIEDQLKAFSRDDGAQAFSFAAPSIRQMFTTEDRFLGMVREGYKPVYRNRSHVFGELKDEDGQVAQSVYLVDEAGEDWVAVYTMEMQPDGTWKISGCFLVQHPGQAA